MKILDYSSFEDIFVNFLNTYAPIKTKIIRANNHESITKALGQAIITRSGLKNVYSKNQNTTNQSNYKQQRNFCTNLPGKTKFEYFRATLNDNETIMKNLNDNETI